MDSATSDYFFDSVILVVTAMAFNVPSVRMFALFITSSRFQKKKSACDKTESGNSRLRHVAFETLDHPFAVCVLDSDALFKERERGKSVSHSHKKAVLFQKTSNFDGKGVREVREMGCHCA